MLGPKQTRVGWPSRNIAKLQSIVTRCWHDNREDAGRTEKSVIRISSSCQFRHLDARAAEHGRKVQGLTIHMYESLPQFEESSI